MFVLQCFIKSGFMTNSLLVMLPAVQHMALYLMNINTAEYKWSSGIVVKSGKFQHVALQFWKLYLDISQHSIFFLHVLLFYVHRKPQMYIQNVKIFSFSMNMIALLVLLCCFFPLTGCSDSFASVSCLLSWWI